ncbi:MBL fold metallo-hydrolase [Virgibacillus halophilus]|uniref:MBL fold metallo-hydrolase n=1 Tax=Tigheibacillus halophilus TaxID=361280 RepID=A0ABU5C4Y0_9BACI|nr:MBL fold metallo-hydrolase [Virgibacillus halophilus]
MSEVILHVLGTAQDAGLPHPNCFCKNCSRAMVDPQFRRSAASLAVVLPDEKQWHLIDATPDLKEQMARLQIKYGMKAKLMESIFLTHAHLGHYPGLLFLGREAVGANGMPVMAGGKMKRLLEEQAPWSQLTQLGNIDVQEIADEQAIRISPHVTVTPVDVPHRNEFSETFAFWIKGPHKQVFYVPDIDRWDDWGEDVRSICRQADICLVDGTFYSVKDLSDIGRDYREIPHPLMLDTMERLQDFTNQTDIYFTHLNHSNPAIDPDQSIRREMEAKGFHIAEEGMEIIL